MNLDATVIAAIRADLESSLLHARVEKIFQPSRGDLLLFLRKGAEQHRLFIATENPYPWAGLVEIAPPNPPTPPAFCMLLRKHTAGGRLTRIVQPPFTRHLGLVIEHYDDASGLSERTLHLELWGRRGNVVLVDQLDLILAALWRSPAGGTRTLEPGTVYKPPVQAGKLNPDGLPVETFYNLLARAPAGAAVRDILLRHLPGLSPSSIDELLATAALTPAHPIEDLPPEAYAALWAALAEMTRKIRAGIFAPHILLEGNRCVDVAAFPRTAAGSLRQEPVASVAKAVGRVLGAAAREALTARLRSNLAHKIHRTLARAERKHAKQRAELAAAEQADRHRELGASLLAHLAKIPRGATEVELPSASDPGRSVRVPLDPSLSASANAQVHFRRFQRAKRGRAAIQVHLAKTEEELAYLAQLAFSVTDAGTEAELAEIAAEMVAERLAPATKTTAPGRIGPHRHLSLDGLEILVGRNNKQNERLTFALAKPDDIWLHTREIPGAHIVIRRAGYTTIPASTLLDAANLAVHHSQARAGAKVPVDYTERRHVRKRPGGRPGLVTYDRFRTVVVDPDDRILQRLLVQPHVPPGED